MKLRLFAVSVVVAALGSSGAFAQNAFRCDQDGKTVREPTPVAPPNEPQDPQALADCLEQLPKDSIDAERARDQRVMDRWGWSSNKLGR